MSKEEQLLLKNTLLEKELTAKNRELEIEASLERVREKAMAMRSSEELKEVVKTLFEELTHLDVNLQACLIATFDPVTSDQKSWIIHVKSNEPYSLLIPYNEQPFYQEMLHAWKERNANWSYMLEGEPKISWENFLFNDTEFRLLPKEVKEEIRKPKKVFFAASYYPYGAIQASSPELLSNTSIGLLQRFSKVFDSCYTRFLDLKKAESQTREAQIQLALERVRAKTMAMQKQNDLLGVLELLVEQLVKLGVDLEVANFSNGIPGGDWDLWIEVVTDDGTIYNNYVHFPRIDHPYFSHVEKNIEIFKSEGKDLFKDVFSKEEKDTWQDYINLQTIYKDLTPENHKKIMYDKTGYVWSMIFLKDTWVSICRFNTIAFSDEEDALFRRFASAFGQAYTRFLDLQKAEAQARESQIQLALERVRAKTMAMQKSEELQEVVHTLLERLKDLNVEFYTAIIILFIEDSKDIVWWLENKERQQYSKILVPYADIAYLRDLFDAKENGSSHFSKTYSFEEKNELFHHLFSHTDFQYVPQKQRKFLLESKAATFSVSLEKNTGIHLTRYTDKTFSEEDNAILKRFANVFEQTYTRFLDLQKAEAQAREAEIQLALERVRARTMAMQKSNELGEVASLLFAQVKSLGIDCYSSGFTVWENDNNQLVAWMSNADGSINPPFQMPSREIEWHRDQYESWNKKEDFIIHDFTGQQMLDFYKYLRSFPLLDEAFKKSEAAGVPTPLRQVHNAFNFSQGNLLFITLQPVPESFDIFKRFAKVFEQTYTRFLDLQKAEAQAREAEIELGLERVRARAMAMQSSEELSTLIATVFTELTKLDLALTRCIIWIFEPATNAARWWMANMEDPSNPMNFFIKYHEHPAYLTFVREWKNQNIKFVYDLKGKDKIKWDEILFNETELKNLPGIIKNGMRAPERVLLSASFNNFGGLNVASLEPLSEEHFNLLLRFAKVFDLTYTRFNDLKQAEAQTREAQIEASLERVRSRTLAMQKSEELAETAAVLFKQLINLGIEPNRLYISLIKDEESNSEFWITDEDGSKVSLAYYAKLVDNASFKKMFYGWKEKKRSIIIDMQGEELENYFHHLTTLNVPFKGELLQKRRVQYLAYFSKGFIGMASPEPQPDETLQLLERFAYVFNLTYTRFNDLQIAEAHALQAEQDLIEIKNARRKAEEALTELQAAQKQLIQSEKMASLGELTAGIAHEIQNPLNFVNNFSEVNKEMIDEASEEINKGNYEEVQNILNDIKENSEKINHHGKRADAIVKGMLQHSRKSSGQKELTDINALADEYLRLSYHGLRAKDKNFNAEIKTDFDQSIGKINIIPQDIGRVLLNLFNNAFYAVNEQKSKNLISYEPTVFVQTSRNPPSEGREALTITVRDNGNGIPQNIVDKIFQPFFTTKPTGQGTGLGLSLSYDIVKAHGGEIKVESKEGEGSEFVIQLPFV